MRQSFRWKLLKKRRKRKGVKEIIDTILLNRGIKTIKDRKEFLFPPALEDISFKNLGIEKDNILRFLKIIKDAKNQKKTVIIFGDYDVDGVCSTAILWETLWIAGLKVFPYLPDRFEEGYGLTKKALNNLLKKYPSCSLIITVDNGISARVAIAQARKKGIDVIVVDHHQRPKRLPRATLTIHSTNVCAASLAWFLSYQVFRFFAFKKNPPKEYAALATVADQMPLLGVNRVVVKEGIEALRKTKRVGLIELYKISGVKKEKIGVSTINYVIAPRLNAAGRIEHAIDSLRLLLTRKVSMAKKLALTLDKLNTKRQKIVEKIFLHAKEKVLKEGAKSKIILVAHDGYHEGVIGLVASKLVEEFYRPAIVFSKKKKISKASARSIPGFNIEKAIRTFEDMLVSFGGHSMAAGLSIDTELIDKFSKEIKKKAEQLLTDSLLKKELKVDLEISLDEINFSLISYLKKLEPFGMGNPAPLFLARDLKVLSFRLMGEGKHIRLRLAQGDSIFDAVGFEMENVSKFILSQKLIPKVDVVFSLEENIWNNTREIRIILKDLRPKYGTKI